MALVQVVFVISYNSLLYQLFATKPVLLSMEIRTSGAISRSLITFPDGLLCCSLYVSETSVSMMFASGQPIVQCSVRGQQQHPAWNGQCSMAGSGQWNFQSPDVCYGVYDQSVCEPPVQCYKNYGNDVPGYYPPQQYYQPVQMVPRRPPLIPDLPCHQNQQWNYNTMCYNVDGQPCQYTNVVDLEDFM